MKFISNRDIVVRSAKAAQAIRFVKGQPQDVPQSMVQEVLDRGILPVEDSGEPIVAGETELVADPILKKMAPEDGDERRRRIVEVLAAIVKRNDSKEFTSGGMPAAGAVSMVLGWRVDSKEIKEIWKVERNTLLEAAGRE